MGDVIEELVEREHRAILTYCGFAEDDVPGALAIATALLGERSVFAVEPTEVWGEGEATADSTILVRGDLSPRRRDFVILHEVGEIWVHRLKFEFDDFHQKERACDGIAAALIAPTLAFVAAVGELRDDFAQLGIEFEATQTAMALRFGEVTRSPVRVFRPGLVRERGAKIDWSAIEPVRIVLTDEPERFVELAAA